MLAAASTWATRLPPPSPGSAGRFKSAPAGRPSPLSAGAPFPEPSWRRVPRDEKSCPQPPRPSKLVVASRPCSESKECLFAAPPWFTRAGEVGQLNQADSRSLRSLRNLHRIKSKQSQFWLRAANKRHVLLCSEAASKPMPARSQRSRTNPQVWCLKSSKIDETKSEKAEKMQSSARRRLQAFSRENPQTQSIKGQKWPVKCRNAVEPEQDAPAREFDAIREPPSRRKL